MNNQLTGSDNISIGNQSQFSGLASGNISIGSQSLQQNTSGTGNLAIGTQTLYNSLTGSSNVGLGQNALYNVNSGAQNTGIGSTTLNNLTTGNYNIAIGYQTGANIVTGSNNIVLGQVSPSVDISNCVILSGSSAWGTGPATAGNFYVKPVSSTTNTSPTLVYDITTGLIQYSVSSQAYKTNIKDISYDTTAIYRIQPVEYDDINTNAHQTGFIAEDVGVVDVNLTWPAPDGSILGVSDHNIMVYMLAEMQKMHSQITILQAQVNTLQLQAMTKV